MQELIFSDKARQKLIEGIRLVAKPVGLSMGPRGKNTVIDRKNVFPVITNDGVTIANSIRRVKDDQVNVGVQMIKEVANKANIIGDGTTTTTILAASLIEEGLKRLSDGHNPLDIKKGMEKASQKVIEELKTMAVPADKERLVQVATVSTEDEELGRVIGELRYEVGKDGVTAIENSSKIGVEKDRSQGIKFEQGFLSNYMINDPRGFALNADIPILVTDEDITEADQIVPICDALLEQDIKKIVIICDNLRKEAFAIANKNLQEGNFYFLVIQMPGLDDWRPKNAEDIAVATGANFISKNLGRSLADVTLEDLGHAKEVVSKRDFTVIMSKDDLAIEDRVKDRIKSLKHELEEAISDFERDQLKERIARLSNGIGIIRIGYPTQQELDYKRLKAEDGVAAARVALDEGFVAGGGVALLRIAAKAKPEGLGESIFYEAIKSPIKQIAENAGVNKDTVIEKILASDNVNFGWDAKEDEFKDLVGAGIIDPVKVTISAIESAVSMSAMFLTTEAVIVEIEEDSGNKKPRPTV